MDHNIYLTTYTTSVLEQLENQKVLDLIPNTNRSVLEQCIERLFVCDKSLLRHLKLLVTLKPNVPSTASISNCMLVEGLSCLSNIQLVALLTNPLLLLSTANAIDKEASPHWVSVMERERIPYFGKKRQIHK